MLCFVIIAARPAGAELIWNGKEWVKPAAHERGTPGGDLVPIRRMVEIGRNEPVEDAVLEFLGMYPESPAREEAIHLAGQALMNMGDYWEAYDWFETQVTEFPNGLFFERALDREFRIADAYLKGRKRKMWKIFRLPAEDEGIEILTQIVSRAPAFEIARRALLRIADYYYDDESHADAVDHYDQFVKLYPGAEERPYAMFRAAKACLLDYKGVDFDRTPLLKARLRFRTFAAAFPRESEKRNIAGVLKEIDESLAHKLFSTAAFYERVEKPRSAAYYYREVARRYPRTEWARTAETRVAELDISGRPAAYDIAPPGEVGPGREIPPPSPDEPGTERVSTGTSAEKKVRVQPEAEKTDTEGKERLRPLDLEDIIMMDKKNRNEK